MGVQIEERTGRLGDLGELKPHFNQVFQPLAADTLVS